MTPTVNSTTTAPDQRSGSGIMAAAARRMQHQVRVRLLIAIPVVIVLLLTVFGGFIYYLIDAGLSDYADPIRVGVFSEQWLLTIIAFDIVGAVVGIYLAHSITQPIRQMISITEKVGVGDFSSKARVERKDEVGELGHSFNTMVESLNQFITARNRFILESFSGGLITTDVNGTITAINTAAERLLGLQAVSVAGKPAKQVFAEPEMDSFRGLVEEVLWKQTPITSRRIEIGNDGRRTVLSVNTSTIRDDRGQVYGHIINFRDLAAIEKFYEQMQREERLATLGTFAAGLAHEVLNPLGAIKGTAQLLAEDVKTNPGALEHTKVIVKEADRLSRLVREVQEFSRPSPEEPRLVRLDALAAETLQVARQGTRKSAPGVQIIEEYNDIPPTLLPYGKIKQALLNILVNAFEATTADETIMLRTYLVAGDPLPLRIQVCNTGSHIAEEELARVFEPFFTTKELGTGLGLSIAYQIVGYYGGTLEATSSETRVCFTIKLPHRVEEERRLL